MKCQAETPTAFSGTLQYAPYRITEPGAPANFNAQYWHTHGIAGKAYGFPYDDVGGYSSDISCNSPQYLAVAVGW
jgi:Beta-1,3-glucanase